ncbi:MAG: metal ABC transporter solute-binding protein, Zn/Mn family [Acetivibrionales bacterium]
MIRFSNLIILLSITVIVYTLCGCSKNVESMDNRITVAVSIVPEKTFVKKVAGDMVNIVTLVPPGYSPENYQPNPQQIENFSKASLYFSMDVPTEEADIHPKVKDLNPGMKIVHLSQLVGEIYPHRYFGEGFDGHSNNIEHHNKEAHHHEGRDPHIWLSPKRVKVMVDIIREELSELDSKNKEAYTQNAAAFKKELDELDDSIKKMFRGLEGKSFIVYHPSLGYFADDYGLEMLSLEQSGKQATVGSFRKIIDKARHENIKVIFYQAEVDSKQSRTFAEEIGGRALQIDPLSENYIENLKKIGETISGVLGREE